MASVSSEKSCGSAVNVSAYVGISSFSATRASATSTTVTLKFKVYVYTSSSGGYTYNSLCVWVDGGSKRTVFNSNSGSNHTTKGKKYYTSTITLTKTVGLGSTTTSFTVGVNGTAWNPSSPKKTFTFNVSGIPKGSYTVTYDANGGTDAPGNQTKWHGEDLILSGTKPTRYGYAFQGWLVPSRYGSTFDDIYYQPGGLNQYNGDQTLVAYWRKWIGLNFDVNSGSGAPSVIVATVDNAVTTYTFTIPNTTPTRTGYNFLGWGTASSDTTAKYKSGDKITLEYTATLYAIWQLKTYTITYNANGGSGAPSAQTKQYGINISLSTTQPTRSGYKFLGWSTSASSKTPSYLSGANFTTNATTTLYAVWEQLGIAYMNVNRTFQAGRVWVNDNGTWMTGIIFVNDNGTWTQGGI